MQVHLLLLAFLVILNLIPDKFINRKKWILPLSFLLILAYWAFRYDYGLDYWDYLNSFYTGTEGKYERGFGERGYYIFAGLFSRFYQVIFAQSIIVAFTLFFIVRKYIPSNCYWLFFILLFLVPRFHFVMISALRNSLAACIIIWTFELCYISKKRWLLFVVMVLFAAFFHTTALAFLLFPLVHFFYSKMRGMSIFFILIILDILSLFIVNLVFSYAISQSSLTETYDNYSDLVGESNIIGLLFKSIILIPTFYISKAFDRLKKDTSLKSIFIIAFFFLSIELFGLNFLGRFTLYIFLFFIISISITYQYYKKSSIIWLAPYLLYIVYGVYKYYQTLASELTGIYSEGNYLFYHTIFEVTPWP